MRVAPVLASLVLFASVAACSSDPEPLTVTPRDAGSGTGSSLPATFEKGVMVVFGESCALTACHAAQQSNLGIHITFDKAQVYGELQKESPTFPGVKFVVPGKPDESFVMVKMDGTHGALPACGGGCGREMPPDDLLPADRREVVRKWIANGAKND